MGADCPVTTSCCQELPAPVILPCFRKPQPLTPGIRVGQDVLWEKAFGRYAPVLVAAGAQGKKDRWNCSQGVYSGEKM